MIYIFIVAGIFFLDYGIKRYIDKRKVLGEEKKILKGHIIVKKYYNEGAALNFLRKKPHLLKAIQTGLIAATTGVFAFLLGKRGNHGVKMALSFLLGGGLSNLYDRYKKHHVVDYFSFETRWKKLRNIVFNISDFFIFFGALMLLVCANNDKEKS